MKLQLDIYVGSGIESQRDLVLHVVGDDFEARFTLNELVQNGELERNMAKFKALNRLDQEGKKS